MIDRTMNNEAPLLTLPRADSVYAHSCCTVRTYRDFLPSFLFPFSFSYSSLSPFFIIDGREGAGWVLGHHSRGLKIVRETETERRGEN